MNATSCNQRYYVLGTCALRMQCVMPTSRKLKTKATAAPVQHVPSLRSPQPELLLVIPLGNRSDPDSTGLSSTTQLKASSW